MGGVADVLGFSCRLPESGSPSEFWKNLMDGVDMVSGLTVVCQYPGHLLVL